MATPKTSSAGAKTPNRYAAGTPVEAKKTRQEIDDYLRGRGAENVIVTTDDDRHLARAHFRLFGRTIDMRETLPTAATPRMRRKSGWREPDQAEIEKRVEAETRRRWRVLLTRVKMRLDLVFGEEDEAEREEAFHYEFQADTALPGGGTVREFMEPQIAEAYATGTPPRALPPPGAFRLLEGD